MLSIRHQQTKSFFYHQTEIKNEELNDEHQDEDQKITIKSEEKEVSIGAEVDQAMGRLVMTVAGVQKQLIFGPNDLLSTATMLDGDKVSV